MPQTIIQLSTSWLLRASVPTLAVAGLATAWTMQTPSENKTVPTDRQTLVQEFEPESPGTRVIDTARKGGVTPPKKMSQPPSANMAEDAAEDVAEDVVELPGEVAGSHVAALEIPEPEQQSSQAAPAAASIAMPAPLSPAVSRGADGITVVKVFYATDRLPSSTWQELPWLSWVAPLILAMSATIAIVFLLRGPTRQWWPLVGFTGGLVCLWFVHGSYIRIDRLVRLASNMSVVYSANRFEPEEGGYPLRLGVSEVTLPPNHERGRIEAPSIFKGELFESEKRHVVLRNVHEKNEEIFFEDLRADLSKSSRREVLVFIHGYNVAFSDAVKRTAQLHNDLEFPGMSLCYSWPSQSVLLGYTADESAVGWTVAHLETLLQDVHQRTEADRVHLIAHSMGNRALAGALERLILRNHGSVPWLGQVVMAAPDLDTGELRGRYLPLLSQGVGRLTLYTSRNDRALIASAALHGASRAGLAEPKSFIVPGVDTIDVSPIDTSLLGHSYYGDKPEIIRDIRALVELGSPAHSRSWLSPVVTGPDRQYWIFTPRVASRGTANNENGPR